MNFLTNIAQYYFEHPFQLLGILLSIQIFALFFVNTIQKWDNKVTDLIIGALTIFGFAGYGNSITPKGDYKRINSPHYLTPYFSIVKKLGLLLTTSILLYSLYGITNKVFIVVDRVGSSIGSAFDSIFQAGLAIGFLMLLSPLFIPLLLFSFFDRKH